MVFEETIVLTIPFDEALTSVKEAFAANGFGTLTEIDLQATLRTKIGAEIDRYVIVGACNPTLASRAIEIEPRIGVLLPCNVVVRQVDDQVVVEAMDPGLLGSMTGSEELQPIAAEARERINAALEQVAAPLRARG